MILTDIADCTLDRGWLFGQSAAFQAQVLRLVRMLDRQAGDVVEHSGNQPAGLHGIASGAIGIRVPDPEGRMTLASITRRGNWFGQTPSSPHARAR